MIILNLQSKVASQSHLGIEVPALPPGGAGEAVVCRSPGPSSSSLSRRWFGGEVRLYPLPSVERLVPGGPGGCDSGLNIL